MLLYTLLYMIFGYWYFSITWKDFEENIKASLLLAALWPVDVLHRIVTRINI